MNSCTENQIFYALWNERLWLTMRKLRKFIKYRILGFSHQRKDMDRTKKKWELIRGNLPEHPGSLLDIGSSEGYFTRKAASIGWCSFGIERLGSAVNYSNKMAKKENIRNVFFAQGEMNLNVAKNLPNFDVIIMASTFQEICTAFGLEEGYTIFDNILRACRKVLIFETSTTNRKYGAKIPIFEIENEVESIERWVKMLVGRSPGWTVLYGGKIAYSTKEPYRFMFIIKKG